MTNSDNSSLSSPAAEPVAESVTGPSFEGVDARGILDFLDAVESDPDLELHSIEVLKHGRRIAAGWAHPYTEHGVQLLYSLSKSFTSTALGLAVLDGLVDLDDVVLDYFPAYADVAAGPRVRAMRVRHLASMATGHQDDTYLRAVEIDLEDPVRGFLMIEPEHEPGSFFAYNQPATYTLAAIVQAATGRTLADYLAERLFAPLGLPAAGWKEYPEGRSLGFTGLYATTTAVARLGQFYLQDGIWNGVRILPAGWVAEATRAHVATHVSWRPDINANPDWSIGYGFQFWMSQHGYRGDGAWGQFCLVLPELDSVVAITSESINMQSMLDHVWEHLLPALERDGSAASDQALATRLAGLRVPGLDLSADPADPGTWDGLQAAPEGGVSEHQRALTAVSVARISDRWHIRLVDGGTIWEAPIDPGDFSTGSRDGALYASGGWTAERELAVDLLFPQAPHRLHLVIDGATATFRALWRTFPAAMPPMALDDLRTLDDLRAPEVRQ